MRITLFIFLLFTLSACSENENTDTLQKNDLSKQEKPALIAAKVDVAKLWSNGQSILTSAVDAARKLDQLINELLANPDNKKLLETQKQWTQLVETYEQFFAYSQIKKPNSAQFAQLRSLQNSIASWPIQPGYLDSYGRYAFSGLVFNLSIPITEPALRDANRMTDEQDVTLGFYALEYILFGEKRLRGPLAFRPITGLNEQHKTSGFKSIEELPRNRRRELMRLQSQLILKDLEELEGIWQNTSQQGLKANFTKLDNKQRSRIILEAIATTFAEQAKAAKEIGAPAIQSTDDAAAAAIERQQHGKRLILQLIGLNQLVSTLELADQTKILNIISEASELIHVAATGQANGKMADLPPKMQWQVVDKRLQKLAEQVRALN